MKVRSTPLFRILNSHLLVFMVSCTLCQIAQAQEQWTPDQQGIIDAITKLSAATAPDGGGADAYAEILAEDFNRWTMGTSAVTKKTEWVNGIRGWFGDGWRVVDRESQYIEITVRDKKGFVRRIVTETYRSPEGESSSSQAALSEVWVRQNEQWLLSRAEIAVMNN